MDGVKMGYGHNTGTRTTFIPKKSSGSSKHPVVALATIIYVRPAQKNSGFSAEHVVPGKVRVEKAPSISGLDGDHEAIQGAIRQDDRGACLLDGMKIDLGTADVMQAPLQTVGGHDFRQTQTDESVNRPRETE